MLHKYCALPLYSTIQLKAKHSINVRILTAHMRSILYHMRVCVCVPVYVHVIYSRHIDYAHKKTPSYQCEMVQSTTVRLFKTSKYCIAYLHGHKIGI